MMPWKNLKALAALSGFFAFSAPQVVRAAPREYIRLLSWTQEPLAQSYTITVEQKAETGEYRPFIEKNSFESKLYWAFPEGLYRFRVAVVDIYGGETAPSPWEYFVCSERESGEGRVEVNAAATFGAFRPVSAALFYTPLFSLGGNAAGRIDSRFQPQGFGAAADFRVLRVEGGLFGGGDLLAALALEWGYLFGSYTHIDQGYQYINNVSVNLVNIMAQLAYRVFVYEKKVDISAGFDLGYSILLGKNTVASDGRDLLEPAETVYRKGSYLFALGGGLRAGWHFSNAIIVYAAVRAVYLFSPDKPPPAYIRPSIGIGWSFE